MGARSRGRVLVAGTAALSVAASGCGGVSAPSGWLAEPEEMGRDAFGSWIEVRGAGDSSRDELLASGELIAVGPAGLWVLPERSTRVRLVPRAAIASARVAHHRSKHGPLAAWTALGTVSTLSHGGYLLFTAPLWLIGGSIATKGQARLAMDQVPPATWSALAAYSRFPQGMPPGFEETEVRPKTVERSRSP